LHFNPDISEKKRLKKRLKGHLYNNNDITILGYHPAYHLIGLVHTVGLEVTDLSLIDTATVRALELIGQTGSAVVDDWWSAVYPLHVINRYITSV